MKIYRSIILLVLFNSCVKSIENEQIISITAKYIEDFPIGIDNYDYVIRFYKKGNDTILEINQDRIDIDSPLDFLIKQKYIGKDNGGIENRFIKIGNVKINKKYVFIFDTSDSIGSSFYNLFKLKKSEHKLDKINQFNYPFLPVTRIFKVKGNNLFFDNEVDTIKFK